jgi:His/Glu/Gln/Arg/opine family amino acid ABC transporter permease subunit
MQSYFVVILQGSLLTVGVSLMALLVAILFGLAGAAAKLSGRPVLVGLATFYTTIIRGIPDLVLMLLVFYGGTIGINTLLEKLGSEATADIEPFMAGVLTIGFIYGAYMTETFRGAILSIPKGQMEAAWAFGMGRFQTFLRITAAADGALRPARLHQQLAGADQGHRTGQSDRPAGDDLPGQAGQRRHPLALCVFPVHRCAVPGLHLGFAVGAQKGARPLQPGHQAGATVNGLGSHF